MVEKILTILQGTVNMVSMNRMRYLLSDLTELCFESGKMAFISGPRQVGKTTFTKAMLAERGVGNYYNWDETKFRRLWSKDPAQVIPKTSSENKPLIILGEIHKAKSWKRSVKGIYDTLQSPCDIIVTGSAKLNIYRRSSDSLLGRYHNFRLHPFSLRELGASFSEPFIHPDNLLDLLFEDGQSHLMGSQEILSQLDRFGGFPEPLISQSVRTLNLWQRSRIERLIREDLRDLSRLLELSQVEMLASLLPERVASPLSINSLAEDLEVAFNTVKHWIKYLKELFYCYEIKPFSNSLPRSIKKEGKLYLWDWSEVENEGARFENMTASHLLKYVHYLSDTGYGTYDLKYIRNKEKKEIDFLVMKNNKPWFPIEVKLNDDKPSPNWKAFMKHLKCDRAVQITSKENVFKVYKQDDWQLLIVSANKFFSYLV